MRIVVAVLSVLLAGLNGLHTAKIAMMPMFGQHHFKVFSLLGEELQQRGHNVSITLSNVYLHLKTGKICTLLLALLACKFKRRRCRAFAFLLTKRFVCNLQF